MKERILINVEWEGPHSLGKVATLNRRTDKGLYQVYGGHPANGAGTLLYIGLAVDQTFGERIPQGGRWTTQRHNSSTAGTSISRPAPGELFTAGSIEGTISIRNSNGSSG